MSRIKICGLTCKEDIIAVNQAMPDYIGFVFAPGKRQVHRKQVMALLSYLDERIMVVGVFADQPQEYMIDCANSGIINAIQLHGQEDETVIRRLKEATGKTLIKAVSVSKAADINKWQESQADYLLFDHGKGGTGTCFRWSCLDEAGGQKKPFFLAGGIDIGNVTEALRHRPYCVDVSSGVETNGIKDAKKINDLVSIVRMGGQAKQ